MRLALPSKRTAIKWTLGVAGTILLGALGSGVWESLLGPTIHTTARWILDIASFGLKSYKNGVYEQIAADDQYAAAYDAYLMASGIYMIIVGLSIIFVLFLSIFTRRETEQALSRLSGPSSRPEPEITVDALRQELVGISKSLRRQRLIVYFCLLFIGIGLVSHMVSVAKLNYVTLADAHYHLVMRVVSPYFDAREQAQVESDFTQINSREGYVTLLAELESQCKAHGRTVPQFNPW